MKRLSLIFILFFSCLWCYSQPGGYHFEKLEIRPKFRLLFIQEPGSQKTKDLKYCESFYELFYLSGILIDTSTLIVSATRLRDFFDSGRFLLDEFDTAKNCINRISYQLVPKTNARIILKESHTIPWENLRDNGAIIRSFYLNERAYLKNEIIIGI